MFFHRIAGEQNIFLDIFIVDLKDWPATTSLSTLFSNFEFSLCETLQLTSAMLTCLHISTDQVVHSSTVDQALIFSSKLSKNDTDRLSNAGQQVG